MSMRVVRNRAVVALRSMCGGGRSPHLSDCELIRMLAHADGASPATAGDAHLADCTRCAARVRALQSSLGRIATAAEAAADDALPAWRLVRQRQRIMRRIQRAAGG